MEKYEVMRTDTADMQLHKIILGIAENFGADVALKKLDDIENNIKMLEDTPYMGVAPKYPVLKRQGYKVLVLDKNLVFYKINEEIKIVVVYAIVDQRQDYLNIMIGL
jgi:toxin ParE1/3/4